MAIAKRTTIDANAMTTAWSAGLQRSGGRWLSGIRSPRELPNANPDANVTNYLTRTAAAGPALKAGITSPNYLTRLEAGAQAKQASFTGAGQAHAADFGSSAQKLATIIGDARANLPPKGPRGTNTARSTAFQEAMHAKKGQAKANR